ncbi:MAG: RluA family pseudouridine synthase [Polaribacter sp.]|nr:RluA family pseudouridine synthase [Polaribacter sp.]
MHLIESHSVPLQEKPIRLQEYAVGIFHTIPTKSGIKKALKKKLLFVDGNNATTALFIHGKETIELYQPETKTALKKLILPLQVLLEDAYLAIVYKPAGILVSGNAFITIANALEQNLQKSTQKDAVRPQPVHRLDYSTSGVLLIGKTSSAITTLSKLFENKKIRKTYHAITIDTMKQRGIINVPIDKKAAYSEFEVLASEISERFSVLNLIKLHPKTGRKHQLRKHLSITGNPILGDKDYGKEELILKGKGMYLHATKIEFEHPFTKETISITTELPKKFRKIFPNCNL